MQLVDIIIIVVAVLIVGLGIFYQVNKKRRNKKEGLPNCGGCSGCSSSSKSSKDGGCGCS